MIESRDVPCDTCTACCRGTRIQLHPNEGDKPHEHRGKLTIGLGGWYLKHKPGTDECVYLGDNGCTLYGKPSRPIVCRAFDCRGMEKLEHMLKLRLPDFTPAMREAARRLRA